jgi:hypothetical protein
MLLSSECAGGNRRAATARPASDPRVRPSDLPIQFHAIRLDAGKSNLRLTTASGLAGLLTESASPQNFNSSNVVDSLLHGERLRGYSPRKMNRELAQGSEPGVTECLAAIAGWSRIAERAYRGVQRPRKTNRPEKSPRGGTAGTGEGSGNPDCPDLRADLGRPTALSQES